MQKRAKSKDQPEESLFESMVESSPPVLQGCHLLTVASHLDFKLAGLKLAVPRMVRSVGVFLTFGWKFEYNVYWHCQSGNPAGVL